MPLDRVALAQTTLSQVSRWIEAADAKARLLITVGVFLIGITMLRLRYLREWWQTAPGPLFWISVVLAAISMVGLVYSIYCSVSVAIPRREAASRHRSMFFFEHIASEDQAKLKEAFREMSEMKIVDELADQVWNVSQVARIKYDLLVVSTRAAFVGGLAGVLFLLLVELVGISCK